MPNAGGAPAFVASDANPPIKFAFKPARAADFLRRLLAGQAGAEPMISDNGAESPAFLGGGRQGMFPVLGAEVLALTFQEYYKY